MVSPNFYKTPYKERHLFVELSPQRVAIKIGQVFKKVLVSSAYLLKILKYVLKFKSHKNIPGISEYDNCFNIY